MRSIIKLLILSLACGPAMVLPAHAVPGMEGELKLGYIFSDEEGNCGVYRPTYNVYEGAALSLRDFHHQFAGGIRVRADLENLTLKNRRVHAGISRSGLFGLELTGSQYRRRYDFAGKASTRRDQLGGQLWVQPVQEIRLFGGYSFAKKEGESVEWFDPGYLTSVRATDYDQHAYHAGIQLNHRGSMVRTEYRRSDFTDQLSRADDRQTTRFKVVAMTPLPHFRQILLSGGYQHFRHAIDTMAARTSANTVWGGGTWSLPRGYSLKYTFIFDRALDTGEPAATDNITQAAYAGKVWPGTGGVTFGYQHAINDDYYDETQTDGFSAGGWVKPRKEMTFKGQFGIQREDAKDGATLTGDEDLTRYSVSATYQPEPLTLRVKYEDKKRDNADIGSSVDFRRLSADMTLLRKPLGELTGSYALLAGEYQNNDSSFEFTDHVLGGSWLSPVFHRLQAGVDGTYYRSKRDLDVESFSLRLAGHYEFVDGYRFNVSYAAHNFDDLLVYNTYYTANIVEISVSKNLSF